MPEIDVKLSQITPSPIDATTATQLVGVQGGVTDNLFTPQNVNSAPFLSTLSIGVTGAVARSAARRGSDIVNVLDFGAVGDNSHDDTAAIQAAINAASTLGPTSFKGGIVFFPTPSVAYKVSAALSNNTVQSYVTLTGTGKDFCRIIGSVNGFIVDTNDGSSGGPNRAGDIIGIENLYIRNTFVSSGLNCTVGAVRMNGIAEAWVTNCTITGWNGLVAFSNVFRLTCIGVNFNSGAGNARYATVAVQTVTGGFIGCNISSGWWIGLMAPGGDIVGANAQGPYIFGCRIEVAVIGLWIGTTIDGLNAAPSNGWVIDGLQTEQLSTGILLGNARYGRLSDVFWNGNAGYNYPIDGTAGGSIVGGVPGPGTVTVTTPSYYTLDNFGWTSGTRGVLISDPGGAYTEGGTGAYLTATRTSPTTFTYPSIKTGAAGASPQFDTRVQYGIRAFTVQYCTISNHVIPTGVAAMEFAATDLYGELGTYNQTHNTIIGNFASAGWIMPHANNKASWKYIQSNQPGGSTTDNAGRTAGMLFANLPGQAGVVMTPAIEGMEYDIINCNTAVWGNPAAGAGATHAHLRYNGTNWTVMGV